MPKPEQGDESTNKAGISDDCDEDMFVVIIGDENDAEDIICSRDNKVLGNKLEDTEKVTVEYLLETAEKYGLPMKLKKEHSIKVEPEEYLDEYLFDSNEPVVKYQMADSFDGEYLLDEEFVGIDKDDRKYWLKNNKHETVEGKQLKNIQRRQMLPASEQRSFVKEICEEHPELKEDEELLIETLARYMMDLKRPEPPRDFFVMNNIMFECVECEAKLETKPAVTRHWHEKHGPRYLICYACGVDFRSTTNLYKHEKRCMAPDALVVLKARACTIGRRGRGRPEMDTHTVTKIRPPKKRYHCQQCPAEFACKQSLISHELKHSGERPYRCRQCPAAYTSAYVLFKHETCKHSGVQFICNNCDRSFNSKAALIVHLDTHQPLRRYECVECGRRFAQNMGLRLHMRREHLHLPPEHACQVCARRYPRMSVLKTHMLREHGMSLITRKMFYKSLPLLSNTQVQQAKVVLKSDLEASDTSFILEKAAERNTSLDIQELIKIVKESDNDTIKHLLQDDSVENESKEVIQRQLELLFDESDGDREILCESSGVVVEIRAERMGNVEEQGTEEVEAAS